MWLSKFAPTVNCLSLSSEVGISGVFFFGVTADAKTQNAFGAVSMGAHRISLYDMTCVQPG